MSRIPSSRTQGPQAVGELLSRVLNRNGVAAKVEAASVVPEWAGLVGPQIAAVTEPLRVSSGVLLVAVHTSPWIMELNLMKSQILRRLNAGKREGRIEELVFVMAGGGPTDPRRPDAARAAGAQTQPRGRRAGRRAGSNAAAR